MKTSRLFVGVALVLVAFAAGVFASDAPALSPGERSLLAEELREQADGLEMWAEYYAYTPADAARFVWSAYGIRYAADRIEQRKFSPRGSHDQSPIVYVSATPSTVRRGDVVTLTVVLDDENGDLERYRLAHVGHCFVARGRATDGFEFDRSIRYMIPADAALGAHTFEVEAWDRKALIGRDHILVTVVE
jgi:hypothetical protein